MQDELWHKLRRRLQEVVAWVRGDATAVIEGSAGNASGSRRYRLYRPAWHHLGARPLIVMLHGCRQSPDDFAAGTRMHARGEGRGCFVLYPAQDPKANRICCWNWFQARNQQRDQGEPAILATMIREVMARHRVDPARVYVAGLSAGGAMAAIMAKTHPELFAAVGIHSGLPHAVASNFASALIAMRSGPGRRRPPLGAGVGESVPTIVFHGDQDTTVHPDNGEALILMPTPRATAGRTRAASGSSEREDRTDRDGEAGAFMTSIVRGVAPGGRAYTRTLRRDANGRSNAEHWLIHGAGHAWSGGDPAGTFTDPLGPDASREMLRFFREHPRRKPRIPPPVGG